MCTRIEPWWPRCASPLERTPLLRGVARYNKTTRHRLYITSTNRVTGKLR
jgi:hypothetical protein